MYTNALWIAFYFNCNAMFCRLYEEMYFKNWFNFRFNEKNNNDVLNPFYRIVNTVKSVNLMFFTLPAFYILLDYENYDTYKNYINILAAIYSSLDLSAMFFNRNSHISTMVHHTLVQILYYYGLYQDWNQDSIAYLIYIYACYSSAAYLVNGRLAIRQFYINENTEYMINDLSLVCYVIAALLNWTTQIYYLMFYTFYDHIAIKIAYVCVVFMIIYDDIFLMKYLYKNTKFIPKQDDIEEFKKKIKHLQNNNQTLLYNED